MPLLLLHKSQISEADIRMIFDQISANAATTIFFTFKFFILILVYHSVLYLYIVSAFHTFLCTDKLLCNYFA